MQGTDRIIDAMPLPAALIGADQRISSANTGFLTIFGGDLIGRHFITAMRQPALIEAVEQAFVSGSPAKTVYLGGENGHDTTYVVTIAPAGADLLVSLTDTTEAAAAGKMRRDFIANVSHELRTPLTALMGFIETLRGAARDDAVARDRFLAIMAHEAGRMTGLVDALMTLGRLEENERRKPTDPVDLRAVIRAARDSLSLIADGTDVALDLVLPQTPVVVAGDAAQLQQVFTNLIENALKYGASGGVVRVCLGPPVVSHRLRGAGVTVSVQDFGAGIAPHHIARLTERFYRVDPHRSRDIGGTGLGLAIVKHIINRHRGRLRIQSELGAGTKITVLLPVA